MFAGSYYHSVKDFTYHSACYQHTYDLCLLFLLRTNELDIDVFVLCSSGVYSMTGTL